MHRMIPAPLSAPRGCRFCARRFEIGVGNRRVLSGALFDRDLRAKGDELLHGFGIAAQRVSPAASFRTAIFIDAADYYEDEEDDEADDADRRARSISASW